MGVRLTSDSLKVRLCTYFVLLLFSSHTFANVLDNNPVGGTISTTNTTEICIGDNVRDIIHIDLEGNVGDSSVFVRTSGRGVIREISFLPYFDLTGLDEDTYQILHIAYDEFTVPPRIGRSITKIEGWFGFSNQLTVNLFAPFGGIVRAVQDIEQPICVTDGIQDNLTLTVSSAVGDDTGWLMTDMNGVIIQLLNTPTFNFEGSEPGMMSIHHYAAIGAEELRLGQNITKLRGCIDFSRGFIVEKIDVCPVACDIVDPIISFPDGENSISFCVVDDIPDVLTISHNLDVLTFAAVIIGPDGNVLQVDNSVSNIPIRHTTPGVCQLFIINFLTDIPMIPIGAPLPDFTGCFEISNPLQLVKEDDCIVCDVDGGTISVANGGEPTVCVDDGLPDELQFNLTGNAGASVWVVTDISGVIFSIQNGQIFNFEGIDLSSCVVRHLSIRDPIDNFGIGQNIDLIEGCFSFSNPITVTKEINCACNVIGGLLSLGGQPLEQTICVDDGEVDLISPTVSNNIGRSAFVKTDMLGNILVVQTSNSFNLEGTGEGVCQIWHISFDNTLRGLDPGSNVSDLIGCFSLSNPLTITRQINCGVVCDVEGGTIVLQDGTTDATICIEDPSQNSFEVILTGNSGPSTWLVTDLNGNIISIQNSRFFNFENIQVSACQIWHLSLQDPITGFGLGRNVAEIEGCMDFSNPITVNKLTDCFQVCNVLPGTISFGGITQFNVCVDDGLPDNISPSVTGNVGITGWILVDAQGTLISVQDEPDFQFEGMMAGSCTIFHISYDETIMGFVPGGNVANITGCFALSNGIIVNRSINCGVPVCPAIAGMVSLNGQQTTTICVTDNEPDIVVPTAVGQSNMSLWVLTTENGTIQLIQQTNSFNFTGTQPGRNLIWNVATNGDLTGLEVGQNINNIQGCFALSNFVEVISIDNCNIVCDVDGGDLNVNGQLVVDLCVVDNVPDVFTATLTGNVGSSIWIVTDQSGIITATQNSPDFDFTNGEVETCFIYHLSLQDPISGFAIGANINAIMGCTDLSNFVQVNKLDNCGMPVCDVDGGRISVNSQLAIEFCVVDTESDIVTVDLVDNVGSSTWLVTDPDGTITQIQNSSTFDFSSAPVGVCLIWHLSLQDPITGFSLGANIENVGGCLDISNPVTVNKLDNCGAPVCNVAGGSIDVGGETNLTFCVVDTESDQVTVNLTGNVGSSIWLETDSNGNILQIQNSPTFDFTNSGVGTSIIRHLSLTGNLDGFQVGGNINQLAGCFSLSNTIQINRIDNCGAPVCDVVGGSIDVGGETALTICVTDNEPDQFSVSLSGNVGSSIFLETDSEGNILQIQNTSTFDFTNASVGTSFIWHLSLTGNLDGFALGANVNQLAGCFAFSNSIQVNRIDNCGAPVCDVDGGSIDVGGQSALTICVTDNEADVVNVTLSGNTGSSTWLLTDNEGNILTIQNSPTFDFTNVSVGNCLIWHLSLTGNLEGFALGANVVDISGCFDLSNSIAVNKIDNCGGPVCDVDGGSITFADGTTSIEFCTSDGLSDVPEFILQNNSGSSTWIVTNSMGEIIDINPDGVFNFEGSPAGVCFITHLSIMDPVTGFVIGGNISALSGCMDQSNSISVTKITDCGPAACDVIGGTIVAEGGATNITVCVDDGMTEGIAIDLSGNVGPSTWIITDGVGVITEIQNSNIFSFEGDGEGVSFIYHLSLDNTITNFALGESIDNLGGCFSLSNGISVTRQINCGPQPCNVVGGNLTLANGDNFITFCTDDGLNDVLDLVLTGNVGATTFILTDAQGVILDSQGSPNFNFEGTQAGNCLVYHMSLQDPITGFVLNGNISDIQGCFELSNPISVTKVTQCGPETCMVDGGFAMTSDSLTITDACTTDGIDDNIQLVVQDFDGARLWVVTDASGDIINIQVEDVFNFEGTGAGTLFIYNIVFLDPIVGFDIGGNISTIQGCFDLSNPVTINRLTDCTPDPVPVGGNISSQTGALAITVCADDGMSDLTTFNIDNTQGESTWIATDTMGQILIVQAVSTFEFEGLGEGVCQVWNVASFGDLVGLQAGLNIADVVGNFALSNQVTVTREVGCGQPDCTAEGGNLTLSNNETFIIVCVTDSEPDIISVSLSGNVGTSNYLVTDPEGNILSIQNGTNFDLDGSGVGRCFIWHLSTQDMVEMTNFVVGQNINTIEGCFDLSNSIEISKIDNCSPLVCDDIMSGTISSMGDTALTICVDDGLDDNVVVDVVGNVGGSIWITTDNNDIILSTQNDNVFNFEGELSGQCFIRHIAVLDEITGLILGNSISTLSGCFQISDRIEVNRILCSNETCPVSGGNITTSDIETSVAICVTDNMSDEFTVIVDANSGISQFIVTDSVGIIVGIQEGSNPEFDFESSAIGMCQVWHISTLDSMFNLNLGMDINLLEGCFNLSNPITVTRLGGDCANPICADVLSGSISFIDGSVDTTVCVDDGIDENLQISLTGNTGAGIFILTTETGLILDLENDPLFNFEGSNTEVCLIYYASILDPFGGLNPGENITDVTGCVNLSNILRVEKVSCAQEACTADGGVIATSTGLTEITLCADDEIADPIDFTLSGATGISMWLITDNIGNVIQTFDGSTVDFEGSDEGRCLIVHATVQDSSFIIRDGDNTNDLTGCFALSNVITIDKEVGCAVVDTCDAVGGVIATSTGLTEITVCADDEIADPIDFTLSGQTGISMWLITDTTGNVIETFDGSTVDFEGSDEGRCVIIHASVQDSSFVIQEGDNTNNLDGCFALSNMIIVDKEVGCAMGDTCDVVGGVIATSDGLTEVNICSTDGFPDNFEIDVTGNVGEFSVFLLTDTAGVIIALQNENILNLEGLGAGTCFVQHASLRDSITGGEMGININELTGCIDVSNAITIFRDGGTFVGGTIADEDGNTQITVCNDDGVDEMVTLQVTGNVGTSVWLLTDPLGGIVEVFSNGPPFAIPDGTTGTTIVHVSFSPALIDINTATSLLDFEGCFDLSNSVALNFETGCGGDMSGCPAEGGMITVNGGLTSVDICSGDGFADVINIEIDTTLTGFNEVILITDTLGVIIGIEGDLILDFEGMGEGTFQVFNLSFVDSVGSVVMMGNIADVTGCTDISNPVLINVEVDCVACPAEGGVIALDDQGTDTATICAGDGEDDILSINLTGESGDDFFFIVTDTTGVIISAQDGANFNFDGGGPGDFQIWHMSVFGTPTGIVVGNNISTVEGCLDLSNPILVMRTYVDGGTVQADSMQTNITICVGDGEPDVINLFNDSDSDLTYTYLITDLNNRLLAFNSPGSVDLEGLTVGMCRIYGVSHTGTPMDFIVAAQQDVTQTPIAECFELSDNFVQLNRVSGNDCPGAMFAEPNVSLAVLGNPVDQVLTLDINSENIEGLFLVELRDINGLLIYSETMNVDIGTTTKTLDVSSLSVGIYYATVRHPSVVVHERIVVQH